VTSSEKKKSAIGFGPIGSNKMDFSGKERDKLFLSDGGKKFVDVSYLGGVDNPQDGRTIATADLDHDGTLEMLVAYRNAPTLRIYRASGMPVRGRVLGLMVSGGASPGSNTDAIGARVTATCAGKPFTRVIQVGTGFATQNAHTVTMGVGACEKIDELKVRYPHGLERVFKNVKTDEMYSLKEDGPLHNEPAFFSKRSTTPTLTLSERSESKGSPTSLLSSLSTAQSHDSSGSSKSFRPTRDVVFVTFWASWCQSCKKAQPRLDELAKTFAGRVEFVGVTLDEKDDASVVTAYAKEHKPGYALLSMSGEARAALLGEVKPWFRGGPPPLPSALVIDRATGRVLLRAIGAPTVSELELALSK